MLADRSTRDVDISGNPQSEPLALSERDAAIVHHIEQEGLTGFSFDGLRRLTGTHPETLSRILERLEEVGIVARVPDGYAITERARGQTSLSSSDHERTRIPLLHTLLPYDGREAVVVQSLKGKWFDRLRWIGTSQAEEGLTLKWVTEDGSVQLDARFSQGQLDIDARVRIGTDASSAVKLAHQLMSRITRLYSGQGRGVRMMFSATTDSSLRPAAM